MAWVQQTARRGLLEAATESQLLTTAPFCFLTPEAVAGRAAQRQRQLVVPLVL